jgi:hypothetical protein
MSIFNVPINPNISGSLALRQELMGRETRSPQELSFLNSNTAWVKLNSSVNVDGYGDTLAKQNVLVGGTLFNGNQRFGVGVENNNAYSLKNTKGENNILGIRPMPGITSVSIDNIGAYGSVRKATVNFQCWDIKQLEVLESLYMRPGYTVLLEFGRNIKLVRKNGINSIEAVRTDDTFFTNSNINLHNYLKDLHQKSVNSGGNYDAFFGYITNYGWAVRPDGGYDCHTEIISTGEVLESIKVNYSAAGAIDFTSLGIDPSNAKFQGLLFPQYKQIKIAVDDIKQFNEEYVENSLAGLIYETYKLCFYDVYRTDQVSNSSVRTIPIVKDNKKFNIDYCRSYYDSENQSELEKKLLNGSKDNYYITLESFCNLFTNFILPNSYSSDNKKTGDLVSLSTYDREYLGNGNDKLLCLFNSYITSVNPDVCLIKNPKWTNILTQSSDIQITVDPIKTQSYSAEGIDVNFQKQIAGWIKDIIITRKNTSNNSIRGQKINEVYNNILKDFEFKKAKTPSLTEQQYSKDFTKNYQLLRGGILESPTTKSKNIFGIETNPDESSITGKKGTEFVDKNPLRSWIQFSAYANFKDESEKKETISTLRTEYGSKDNMFGNLFNKFDDISIAKDNTVSIGIKNSYNTIKKELENSSNLNGEVEVYNNNVAETLNTAVSNKSKINQSNNDLKVASNAYSDFQNRLDKNFKYDLLSSASYGIIGNIYINLKHLYKLAKDSGMYSQDTSGKNILSATSFLKALLRNIQESLGNLNNFEIHIDDKDGIGRIIDLNYINKDDDKNIFEFEIGNNKSIIRDLKLESQIFSDQSSMIAISAQSEAGKMGLDNSTNVSYNLGISDRMLPKKDSPITNGDGNGNQINNFISALSVISNKFFKPFYKEGKFNASEIGTYSNSLRDIILFFNTVYNTDSKEKAIFPTQISLTLDGISGFVIGNLFKVNQEFIPNYYKKSNGKLGYLITKIGQSIQDNSWTTTIQGYPFNIDNSLNSLKLPKDDIQFDLIINYNPNTGQVSTTVGTSIPVKVDDIAIKMIDFFKREGFSNAQMAGIMGNAFAESSLNPTVEITDTNGLPSGGIFQWNGPRFSALKNYSTKIGKDYKTVEAQLAYLTTEPDYKNTKQAILRSDKVDDATFAWANLFERCAICSNRSAVISSNRYQAAFGFLQKLDGGYYSKLPAPIPFAGKPKEKPKYPPVIGSTYGIKI